MPGEGPVDAPVTGELAGVFRYDVDQDVWWWSDEVFALHGLTSGEVTPTTKLLLEHGHPEDREHTREMIEACLADGEPFSCYHRIVAPGGKVRRTVVVGDGRRDATGRVVTMRGFFLDVTEPVNREIREISDRTISAARESQQTIDLARGIVMGVYGVDPDAAFTLLRRQSQHTNTPLRDIAAALVEAAPAPHGSLRAELRRGMESVFYPGA
jgi:hypothetical protein